MTKKFRKFNKNLLKCSNFCKNKCLILHRLLQHKYTKDLHHFDEC